MSRYSRREWKGVVITSHCQVLAGVLQKCAGASVAGDLRVYRVVAGVCTTFYMWSYKDMM